jgi:phenylacetate-coenzyme A ligase PaaK-like adenylate-forming protein
MTATMSRADRLRALAAEQLQRDGWSRDELLAHQRRRLDDLLAHAAASSPYYRAVLGRPDPAGAQLEQLPVLTKLRQVAGLEREAGLPRS